MENNTQSPSPQTEQVQNPTPPQDKQNKPANQKRLIEIILIIVIILLTSTSAFFLGMKQNKQPSPQSQSPSITTTTFITPTLQPTLTQIITPTSIPFTITPSPTVQPTIAANNTNIPSGWVTYTNTSYGFSISHPPQYKELTDKDNLYGWPKAIVLLYSGGQAYDIAVEAWDNESEYKSKYPTQQYAVKKIGNKYITVTGFTEDVQQIIATFKEI